MWRVTWKGAVAHRLRYALTALAVLLGVALMSGTLVFTDTIHATFNGLYDQIYQSVGAVVRSTQPFSPTTNFTEQRQLIPASLATTVAKASGVKAVGLDVEGYAQLVGHNGKVIGTAANGPPTLGVSWIDNPALNDLRLLPGGHAPVNGSEVVIDEHSADVGHFKVGESVTILTQLAPARYTIVGIATWGTASSPLGATICAFDTATAERVVGQPGKVDQIDVEGQPGISQSELVHNVQAVIHGTRIEVVTGQTVTQEGQQAVAQALGVFNTFLLIFALVSLAVGAFLILNTFSIVVAQRARELALLRAVGASRRQVTRSVLGESFLVGVVASLAGLLAGIGLAILLRAGMSALGLAIPANGLVISPRTVVVALLVGTALTVASAISPARRAGRVPPVVAMQGEVARLSDPPSRRRISRGVRLTLLGLVLVVVGLVAHLGSRIGLVGVGSLLVLVGLSRLGPVFSRPVIGALSRPLARSRTGRLARENAMRNPTRTSTTAAALMVGVALMSVMAIFASSIKSTVDAVIATSMKADLVISTGGNGLSANGLSPVVEHSLAALPQVAAVTGVRAGQAEIYGKATLIEASDPAEAQALFDLGAITGNPRTVTASGMSISSQFATEHHLRLGSTVYVTFPTTGRKAFTVQVIYSDRQFAGDYNITLPAAESNFAQNLDYQIYVKLAPGVTPAAGRTAVESVLAPYPNATVMDQAQFRVQQEQGVNGLLDLAYGLLALAVIIALIGITNTLVLSIYERTREIGLLRAVGMTKAQLRGSVRIEASIIAVLGALQGLVVGVGFGAAMVEALRNQGVTHLSIPILQLLFLAAIAAVAGRVAARPSAQRAARLDVLAAITTE